MNTESFHQGGDNLVRAVLVALTFSTGVIDAVSLLTLHVFTSNMTGNVVFVGFAAAGFEETLARSITSLCAFLIGATLGGRVYGHWASQSRRNWGIIALVIESVLLLCAAWIAYAGRATAHHVTTTAGYALIILLAIAMGMRNAVVAKLGVPDLPTTVLTRTISGLAAESSLGGGDNQRWQARAATLMAMLLGAFAGALLLHFGLAVPLLVTGVLPLVALALLQTTQSSSDKTA